MGRSTISQTNRSADFDVTSGSVKKFGSNMDKASFGAPRESFKNVVGPTNFSYQPFK